MNRWKVLTYAIAGFGVLAACGQQPASPPVTSAEAPDKVPASAPQSPAAQVGEIVHSAEYQRCLSTGDAARGVTVAVGDCNVEEDARLDKVLNQTYQAAVAALSEYDKETAVPGLERPSVAEALRKAQRAWVTFRDAECDARGMSGGTIDRLNIQSCFMELTHARTREIEALRRQYTEEP